MATPVESAPVTPAGGSRNLAAEQRAGQEAPLGTRASAGALQLAARMQLGERVFATVESLFANGDVLVRVQERAYRLALDRSVQPGNLLELELFSTKPAIRFSVVQTQPQAPVSLSGTARMVNQLRAEMPVPGTLAVEALAHHPAEDAGVAAENLQRVLDRSGLFYESHQAQWLEGKRSIAALLLEPQNARRPNTDQARESTNASANQHDTRVNTGHPSHDPSAGKPLPAQPASLVKHQLETIETGHVLMQLQVWDGQNMQWEITDQPHGQRGDDALVPAWRTSVKLDLPRLQHTCARLTLDKSGIQLSLHAQQEASAELMRREAPALRRALEAAGLRVLGIGVHHDG